MKDQPWIAGCALEYVESTRLDARHGKLRSLHEHLQFFDVEIIYIDRQVEGPIRRLWLHYDAIFEELTPITLRIRTCLLMLRTGSWWNPLRRERLVSSFHCVHLYI